MKLKCKKVKMIPVEEMTMKGNYKIKKDIQEIVYLFC